MIAGRQVGGVASQPLAGVVTFIYPDLWRICSNAVSRRPSISIHGTMTLTTCGGSQSFPERTILLVTETQPSPELISVGAMRAYTRGERDGY